MTDKETTRVDTAGQDAARWFVRLDADEPGAAADGADWLAARAEDDRAFERIELAVALGKRLAAEPGSALHTEAARAARSASRRRITRRAFAWGGALAASLLVAAVLVPRTLLQPHTTDPQSLRASADVAVDAPTNPVVVLPAGAVVDASAVAVLPFAAAGDATVAAGLERDVVTALRGVPGLYVIAGDAVQPYAATELGPADIGGQLGARGIVNARVALDDGRVRVSAELRDAATGTTLWRADADRPVADLNAIRYEIAENVAAAMLDAELREQSANAGLEGAPISVSKPLPP